MFTSLEESDIKQIFMQILAILIFSLNKYISCPFIILIGLFIFDYSVI